MAEENIPQFLVGGDGTIYRITGNTDGGHQFGVVAAFLVIFAILCLLTVAFMLSYFYKKFCQVHRQPQRFSESYSSFAAPTGPKYKESSEEVLSRRSTATSSLESSLAASTVNRNGYRFKREVKKNLDDLMKK